MLRNILNLLVCVKCHGDVRELDGAILCTKCSAQYQILDGIPVMISDENELFAGADLSASTSSGFNSTRIERIGRFIPGLSSTREMHQLRKRLPELLGKRPGHCLVIGAGEDLDMTSHLEPLFDDVITSDVVWRPHAGVICDAVSLPFASGSLGCVVANAVLEHVLSPEDVVAEIYRVLAPGGIVIAETPFMVPVHMRQFDFKRFSDLGHRWLFRDFSEVERGIITGPGTALAWSLAHFLRSFARSPSHARILYAIGRILFGWIRLSDPIFRDRAGAYDAAAGFYFIGEKSAAPMNAQDLFGSYRGIH